MWLDRVQYSHTGAKEGGGVDAKTEKKREKTISREKTILDQLEKSDQNHIKLNQQEPDEIL